MWQNKPYILEIRAGEKKFFCMCGKSGNGPFCDGSHVGSGFLPELVEFDRDEKVYVCGCQQSGRRPYCDGSHNRIANEGS